MKIPFRLLVTLAASFFVAIGLSGCGGSSSSGSSSGSSGVNAAFPLKVGDVGPVDPDNPLQEPFVCMTDQTDLGPTIIDNQDGIGDKVTDAQHNTGFSQFCGAGMLVNYYYRKTGESGDDALHPYDVANPPTDVKTVTVNGDNFPFIVRHEEGVINRFIYSVSLLVPKPTATTLPQPGDVDDPDLSHWNHDLVFYFIGGVGVGHTQSYSGNSLKSINDVGTEQDGSIALLKHGYAIINSTGAAASTTYNLKLMGKTAHLTKEQFVAAYGTPDHTFGLGASGGSVQQFAYAQNDPGLLDALVPIQVFPDMITQVAPVGDCELLHYYFDFMDANVNGSNSVDPKWTQWSNRQMVTGLHGIDLSNTDPRYNKLKNSDANQIIQATSTAAGHVGADVCMTEWFGAVPQFFNPLWGDEGSYGDYYDQSVWDYTPISFFDDLAPIFGDIPNTNLARSTFDNVGVQYGLVALQRGKMTKQEFLDLNAHVGGWVPRDQMVEPGYPFEGGPGAGGSNIDPWSARNATAEDHPDPSDVAPRSHASIKAIQNAYKAGLIFLGGVTTPMIIIEPYLEPVLNEHASREPFAVRQRLIKANGNADNLAIWMIGSGDSDVLVPFVLRAFNVERAWLDSGARPAALKTGCYDNTGGLIAEGAGVFKGQVSPDGSKLYGGMDPTAAPNGQGTCAQQFPIYSDARIQAGANVSDHVFKCALKPVNVALQDGTYGNVTFTLVQQMKLSQIFPNGVCDYTQPDQGLPPGWSGS